MEITEQTIKQILCGIPVTLLGLTIYTGDPEVAAMIVFLSCCFTAGLALVVWIPLCWFLGTATLNIIGVFVDLGTRRPMPAKRSPPGRYKPAGKKKPAAKRRPVGWDMRALAKYMRRAAARGMSHDQITAQVRLNGWSDADIQRARQLLSGIEQQRSCADDRITARAWMG